jgi:hypothetical protein
MTSFSVLWFRKVNDSLHPCSYIIAEAEQNLIVGRAVDLLATHFKVRPVCAAFAGTRYGMCLKSLGLAPPARLRRRNPLLLNSTLGEQISDGASLILSSIDIV